MSSLPAANKRGWLYGGLAVSPGVALVRRTNHVERTPRMIAPPARRPVVLVGDRMATAIEPTLRKVLTDKGHSLSRVPLQVLAQNQMVAGPGTTVVLSDLPLEIVSAVATELHQRGARTVVVPPLAGWPVTPKHAAHLARCKVVVVPVRRLRVPVAPSGVPTAAGYASIAGAIWTCLR